MVSKYPFEYAVDIAGADIQDEVVDAKLSHLPKSIAIRLIGFELKDAHIPVTWSDLEFAIFQVIVTNFFSCRFQKFIHINGVYVKLSISTMNKTNWSIKISIFFL